MPRFLDLLLSCLGLLVLAPLLLITAAAVRLTSRGPAFFRQARVGRNGREFRIYKFRTMTDDAPVKGLLTANSDRRITPVGRLLRATKIDELPQLINVLKGEMALVGPRPEIPELVATYTEEMRRLLSVRPGMTGAASLAYRHEERMIPPGVDVQEYHRTVLAPAKAAIELAYLRQRTLASDLGLILATVIPWVRTETTDGEG